MRQALIAKIHIAKKELGLDDDTYRAAVSLATNGKTSCKNCSIKELENVLLAMRKRGYVPKAKSQGKKKKSPGSRVPRRFEEVNKVRALWCEMHRHGFLVDGSENALAKYVKRMTKIESPEWLNHESGYKVIESLKNWYKREMLKVLLAVKPYEVDENEISFNQTLVAYKAHIGEVDE
ncbi:gp16 family protein [Glaciecola sp. 1036]|uniref:gp16 family protein n=1 Tax=Alteromonadaceae TaxID=72275 RepID=UPI003D041F87